MRLVALIAAVLATSATLSAPVPKALKQRPDADRFVGTWDAVVAEQNGKERAKATWTFDDNRKMMSVTPGGTGPVSVWDIRLDPEKRPKEIDIGAFKGIYEFDGEDLRVAFTIHAGRPTTFDPKPSVCYNVLRRVEPKKDQ